MRLINPGSEFAEALKNPQMVELSLPLTFAAAGNQQLTFDKDMILWGISGRGINAAPAPVGDNDCFTIQITGAGWSLIQIPAIGTTIFGDGMHSKPDWELIKPMKFAASETLNVIVAALPAGITRVDFVFHTLVNRVK